MITFYSGTPGSGKSLDMAREVTTWLTFYKKNVICNVSIDETKIIKRKHMENKDHGHVIHLENNEITPEYFYRYAMANHDYGKEGQTLIVIDECQSLFSPQVCKLECQLNKEYRTNWLSFFTQHRHLGYDILLISQFDKLVDAQIRYLFEYDVVHRKATNFGFIGKLIGLFGIPLFVKVNRWYGTNEKCDSSLFFYRKKYGEVYDSYAFRIKVVKMLIEKYGVDEMKKIMGERWGSIEDDIVSELAPSS